MSDEQDKTTLSQDRLAQAKSAGAPRAALLLYYRDGVKVAPLAIGNRVVVGRASPADVVISDPSLSRQHAAFTWMNEGVKVDDLGSTNGTYVRGERIESVMVGPGASLTLGSITVAVNLSAVNVALLDGIEGYESFYARLNDEVRRARSFRRGLALLMVRALGHADDAHVSRWVVRIRAELRPVDHVTLYGPNRALILLTESEGDRAFSVARGLLDPPRLNEPTLVCGVAAHGRDADQLIDTARALSRQARPDRKVVVEGGQEPNRDARPLFASASMGALRNMVERVASARMPVLIVGETGSGKEVVSQAIHERSGRNGPLRSVNCGAIPETIIESVLFGHEKGAYTGAERTTPGVFEQASGGTLFLDEVGELSGAAQAALLRVLETHRVVRVGGAEEIEVDVRVLAATHRDLDAMVREGSFRQDLLYRLNTVKLEVPPLRERPDDIAPLTDRFLTEASRENGGAVTEINAEARALLSAYQWPGNVRELRNVVERAVVLCQGGTVSADDLPEVLRGPREVTPETHPPPAPNDPNADFKERVRKYETGLILDALRKSNGNQTQAAKMLKMPLRTLVHKIKAYGIKKRFD